MISLDISILYQILIFLALWLILSKALFRPYLSLLDDRERQTGGARHYTGDLEHEGMRLRSEYEEKISQARSAAVAVKDAIIQEARQEREKLLHNAREEAARKLDSVRREVQSQLEKERTILAAEVAAVAQDMASKVLGRRVG
jgi:F-type H+-transporting ATPase subunit b